MKMKTKKQKEELIKRRIKALEDAVTPGERVMAVNMAKWGEDYYEKLFGAG
jgi:hypothetical protein